MPYHVELKTVAAQMIAAIRIRSAIEHLPRDIPPACGEVWEFVKANRIAGAGKLVAIYWDNEMNLRSASRSARHSPAMTGSSAPACPPG